jgi:hypothetical protein
MHACVSVSECLTQESSPSVESVCKHKAAGMHCASAAAHFVPAGLGRLAAVADWDDGTYACHLALCAVAQRPADSLQAHSRQLAECGSEKFKTVRRAG